MKKIELFAISYGDIINLKTDFYDNNKVNRATALRLNNIYLKGPKRKICKNCEKKLSSEVHLILKK